MFSQFHKSFVTLVVRLALPSQNLINLLQDDKRSATVYLWRHKIPRWQKRGPRTTLGKSHSSQNALKHGLLSKALILEGENASDFERLLTDLDRDWQPQGAHERCLLETLATLNWRERRLILTERALISRSGPFVGIQGRSDYKLPMHAAVRPSVPTRSDEKLAKFSSAMARLAELDEKLKNVKDGNTLELQFYWDIAVDLREVYGNFGPTDTQPEIVKRINAMVAVQFAVLGGKSAPPRTGLSVQELRVEIAAEVVLRLDQAAR
jgi:hypothetical protein